MNAPRATGASLLVVLLLASGCGAGDAGEPSTADRETGAETTNGEGVVVASARLRESKALEPQAQGEPFPGYDYVGPERVIIELKRSDAGSFVLVMQGVTHSVEPYRLRLATSTSCAEYAQGRGRGDGEAVVDESFLDEGDAPMGGTVHERYVLPVSEKVAAKLLAKRVVAFADSGGAHGGTFIFCGVLETKQP